MSLWVCAGLCLVFWGRGFRSCCCPWREGCFRVSHLSNMQQFLKKTAAYCVQIITIAILGNHLSLLIFPPYVWIHPARATTFISVRWFLIIFRYAPCWKQKCVHFFFCTNHSKFLPSSDWGLVIYALQQRYTYVNMRAIFHGKPLTNPRVVSSWKV